jgi:hypothetical protein
MLIVGALMTRPSIFISLVVTSAITLLPAAAQETPAQTASPAISESVSSFERAAGGRSGYNSSTATADDLNRSILLRRHKYGWIASGINEKSNAYFEGGAG